MKNIIVSLAALAVIGSNAPISARPNVGTELTVVADSTHNKTEHVKQQPTPAAKNAPNTVEENRKKVAAAHDAAAQRRLAEAQHRLDNAQKRLQNAQKKLDEKSARLAQDDDAQEAYSDTTSAFDDDDDANAGASYVNGQSVDDSNRYNPSRFNDPFSWIAFMCGTSFWGVLITLFVLLLVFLFFAMPIIVLFVILRYIIRRHNDRVRLAEMAIKEGRPLSEEQINISSKPRQYLWRKGVRNLSLGIGLALLFYIMEASPLAGIGLLIACMGGGQMFMARYDYDMKFKRDHRQPADFFANDKEDDANADFFAADNTDIAQSEKNKEKQD